MHTSKDVRKSIWKSFLLEEKCQVLQDKFAEIERSSAINGDRTKSLFKILNEIKDSINTIANKIDLLESKQGQNGNELIKTIIFVAATAYFIKK